MKPEGTCHEAFGCPIPFAGGQLIDDEKMLQGFREQHRIEPELWQTLIDRLDARIEARKRKSS